MSVPKHVIDAERLDTFPRTALKLEMSTVSLQTRPKVLLPLHLQQLQLPPEFECPDLLMENFYSLSTLLMIFNLFSLCLINVSPLRFHHDYSPPFTLVA
jgi:hypothetical protein